MGEQEPKGLTGPEDYKAKMLRKEHEEYSDQLGVAREREKLERERTMSEQMARADREYYPKDRQQADQEAISQRAKAEEKYDATMWRAQQHFRENEEAYKQSAVNDAKKAGKDVSYPPYTDQQKGSEDTPDQPQ
ncbi:hypothetical protein HYX70_03670 [Candidatus Saccharibacteria bacterium]|nr:hypothetical protein [Candidatus Saccharibacteria bacterium]